MQQQIRIDCVVKLQAEEEQVTETIHPVHAEVKQDLDGTVVDVLENISCQLVEEVSKVKEDVQWHAKEVMTIFQDFRAKLNMPDISI